MNKGKKSLNLVTLTLINIAAIASLRNLPLMADCGLHMFFFYGIATLAFFIPSALVSAELATTFSKQEGGLYIWVKEAMGPKWALLAIWLLAAKGMTYFPTVLAFIAGTMAFLINPKLAGNPLYTISVILFVFWGGTLINFKGLKASHLISSAGTFLGTILPSLLIIGLGAYWVLQGNPIELSFDVPDYIPNLDSWGQLSFLAGTFVAFAGMELSAVHANSTENPQKTYPKAILISAVLILAISLLGSLSIACVVPHEGISLGSGLMQAFNTIFAAFGIEYLIKATSLFVLFGAIATLKTWIIGPAMGLIETARNGYLPPIFKKVNEHGIPTSVLILQATVVSIFSAIFVLLPSVDSSFWLLTAITANVYTLIFIILFLSAIILCFKRPDLERPFKVPGGKLGMVVVSGTGLLASIFAFCIGFVSPETIDMGNIYLLKGIHVGSILLLTLPPFAFMLFKKNNWRSVDQQNMTEPAIIKEKTEEVLLKV